MNKFLITIQYLALLFAFLCGLVFTVLIEIEVGHGYASMFLALCTGWLIIFTILLCSERCSYEEKLENYSPV